MLSFSRRDARNDLNAPAEIAGSSVTFCRAEI
jgi:hypothetical protein